MAQLRVFGSGLAGLALVLLLGSCEETTQRPDGAEDDGGSATCPQGVDPTTDFKSAETLTEKTEVQGYICPRKDQDFYKITIPAGKKLLRVKLTHTVAQTPVDLTYQVFSANEQPVAKAPAWTGSGIRSYDQYHCLTQTGTFYIVVEDDGGDGKDGNNPYKLSYETLSDPDTHEANDTIATASATTGTGYISCTGDVDFYKLGTVPAGKLLDIKLTNDGATAVDLKYSIYDASKNLVDEETNSDGYKGKTELKNIHSVPAPGEYYLAVEDDQTNDSDPTRGYTLTVTQVNEPDDQDKTKRNDLAKDATTLGTFTCGGSTQTYTKYGYIASKNDIDYFKVDVGKCSTLVTVEVRLSYTATTSEVDPQVTYIYPDSTTTCTKDQCCRVTSKTCTDFLSCLGITSSCVTKGDSYCADKTCEASPTLGCSTEKRCAGATVCLNGYCGVEQATRYDENGESAGAKIATSVPLMHAGPYYIRVNDFKNDDYDYSNRYTLIVRVQMDPDGSRELDSEYFTEKVWSMYGIKTYEYHEKVAAAKGNTVTLGTPITGYISYEGDQDWLKVPWPCTADPCVLLATWSYTGNCSGLTGSKDTDNDGVVDDGLEFVFGLNTDDGKAKDSWPAKPTTSAGGSFGYGGATNKCLLARSKSSNPYYWLTITDLVHNSWSLDCGYSITLTKAYEGCAVPPCAVYQGNCYVP